MISNLYSNLYEQYRERNNSAIFFLFLFKWRDNEKSVKSRIIIISDILYVYMYGTNFLKRKKEVLSKRETHQATFYTLRSSHSSVSWPES